MMSRLTNRFACMTVAALVVVVAAILIQRNRGGSLDTSSSRGSQRARPISQLSSKFELPPVRPSRFLNTSPDVGFVGSEACINCHASEHATYLETAHSRALGEVDLPNEPENVRFEHAESGRTYEVYRRDNQMWHREVISKDGEDLVLGDYPIRYTIGSGNHSRSYLVETDGFLIESPITWYTSKHAWGVSPGYDVADPPGFERLADVGCLICHAGGVEAKDDSRFHVHLHELSIGCESCHGPGSLHVAERQRQDVALGDEDLSIVHPGRLDREQRDAICAQCHLRGDASVVLGDRRLTDFRPSLRLGDFRIDYVLEHPNKAMSVVGHIEQMKMSRCYQQSETMSCTTCHHPHSRPKAEQRVEYFRAKCLECHALDACGLEHEQRRTLDREDNCVFCHMPRSPTDVPHFAFTHHRIGLHEPEEKELTGVGRLIPLRDVSHLPRIEQSRNLGLAYLELSDKQHTQQAFEAYRLRALEEMISVWDEGRRDSEVASALARLHWEQGDMERAMFLARDAIRLGGTSGSSANALFILGDAYLQMNSPRQALDALNELVQLRRQSEDWVLIGLSHKSMGRSEEAIAALEKAAEINPARLDVRRLLVELYRETGNQEAADRHEHDATILSTQDQ